MTIVIGQIESLKRLKVKLSQKGIIRFKSIGEINEFIKNYDLEKRKIINQIEQDLDIELDNLKAERIVLQKKYENLKTKTTNKLNNIISRLISKKVLIQSRYTNSRIKKIVNSLQLKILKLLQTSLENNFKRIIHLRIYRNQKSISKTIIKLNEYSVNRKDVISERSLSRLNELFHTKEVLLELNPLIAGSIGENLVVKELKKLSDKYILFNDFSIDFERPIYYKKDNIKISSIQIDHLLLTNSGLFIIETKNWSKKSLERLDLRSPIKQIERTSFALYVILTYSRQLEAKLNKHHWGEKKIPIRKIVVMINQKPNEKFKFVKIATLNELNRYIKYFEPIYDDSEVKIISNYLSEIMELNLLK